MGKFWYKYVFGGDTGLLRCLSELKTGWRGGCTGRETLPGHLCILCMAGLVAGGIMLAPVLASSFPGCP